MFTALIVTAVLSCKPYHPMPPPETTLACEGADQVRRRTSDGAELGRWRMAATCTRAVCEGADFVRRDLYGAQLERWSFAPQCMVTRCEGIDFVRRDSRGVELERWTNASVCPAPQPVRLTQDPKPVRFGLSSRG
jgi:hypothetical protein